MRPFAGMNETVLLQMGELGEGFRTQMTFERALVRERSEMNFQIGELTERFFTRSAFVNDFAVLFAQRIR